ncbi:MAG: two-component system sensor histidine kinase NtrB [Isosphaeraceae bacterium]
MAKFATSTVSDDPIKPQGRACSAADGVFRPASGALPESSVERAPAAANVGAAAPRTEHLTLDEAELTRSFRAQYAEISQLAGGLAHEIRNPLSTLSLNLDLLAEDFQSAETSRERRALQRIERLRHEVDRLQGIVESFLRFAKIQDLKLQPADLNAIADEMRDFYEPQAATHGIVIRTQFAQDLPPVRLDADLFKQALLNLMLNAQHAMPAGGDLILKTHRDGPWAVLDVIDTGLGMTDEVREQIFNAFFSTRPGGSGLGLPTTRKIVEAHGGVILVRSEPGKGSQFSIRLPLYETGDGPADPRLGGR